MGWKDSPIVMGGDGETATKSGWMSSKVVDEDPSPSDDSQAAQTLRKTSGIQPPSAVTQHGPSESTLDALIPGRTWAREHGGIPAMLLDEPPSAIASHIPSVMDAISTLPAAGGAVGGAIGAAGGTVAAPGAGTYLAGAEGAALGGAAGEAARQLALRATGEGAPKTSMEAASNIAKEALIQGGAQIAGNTIAAGAAKVLNPFAQVMDPAVEAAAARTAVGEAGPKLPIDLPAAARSTSPVVAGVEASAAKGLAGGQVGARYTRSLSMLTEMADHTVTQASRLTDNVARGQAMADGLDTYHTTFNNLKDQLYKEASLAGRGIETATPETVSILQRKLNELNHNQLPDSATQVDRDFFGGMLAKLTYVDKETGATILKNLPVEELQTTVKLLSDDIKALSRGKVPISDDAFLVKLTATLRDEFEAGIAKQAPDIGQKLAAANAAYSEGISKLNSAFGINIRKLSAPGQEKYDLIAKQTVNPNMSIADIPRIKEVVGPEGAEAMQAATLADIFAKAKSTEGPLIGKLTPEGLQREIHKFGEGKLAALLTPEQMSVVHDISTMTSSLSRGQRVVDAANSPVRPTTAAGVVYGLAHTIASWPQALALALGDASYGKFIGSKVGQKWLTTGFPLAPAISATLKQVPRAAEAGIEIYKGRSNEDQYPGMPPLTATLGELAAKRTR